MKSRKFEKLVNLVAERIKTESCCAVSSTGALTDAERRAQLKTDLEALSLQFNVRDTVVAQVRTEIAEHGFLIDKKNYDEGIPEVERLQPPDFGPEGPSDDDIQREIKEIMRKIDRLRKPEQEEEYERKLPWRVQINVALLVSILLELLKLILKLLKRMQNPQATPTKKR